MISACTGELISCASVQARTRYPLRSDSWHPEGVSVPKLSRVRDAPIRENLNQLSDDFVFKGGNLLWVHRYAAATPTSIWPRLKTDSHARVRAVLERPCGTILRSNISDGVQGDRAGRKVLEPR